MEFAEGCSDVGKRGDDQLQLLEPLTICRRAFCDYCALCRVVDVRDRDLDVSDGHTETIGCCTLAMDDLQDHRAD